MSVRSPTTPSMDQALLHQALLPPHRRPNVKAVVVRSKREKLECYLTALFTLAAIGSLAALLMLAPLWAEPAWASLTAGLQANPVTCVTERWDQVGGVGGSCAWTSCRQGCTSEIHRCHHVYVNVSMFPWAYTQLLLQTFLTSTTTSATTTTIRTTTTMVTSSYHDIYTTNSENATITEYTMYENLTTIAKTTVMAQVVKPSLYPKRSADNPRINQGRLRGRHAEKTRHVAATSTANPRLTTTARPWPSDDPNQVLLPENRTFLLDFNATNIPLLINIKGCGYPPEVTCSDFLPWVGQESSIFPCYVAPETLHLAVVQFDPAHSWFLLLTCFFIPAGLFTLFLLLVFLLRFRCGCNSRRMSSAETATPHSRPWKSKMRKSFKFGRQRYYQPGDDTALSGGDPPQSNWAKLQQWAKGHLPNRQRVASNGIWSTKLPSSPETLKLQVVRLA